MLHEVYLVSRSKLASFPGSPSFRAIIPCMSYVELLRGRRESLGTRLVCDIRGIIARKEGEPGNEAMSKPRYIPYVQTMNMLGKNSGDR